MQIHYSQEKLSSLLIHFIDKAYQIHNIILKENSSHSNLLGCKWFVDITTIDVVWKAQSTSFRKRLELALNLYSKLRVVEAFTTSIIRSRQYYSWLSTRRNVISSISHWKTPKKKKRFKCWFASKCFHSDIPSVCIISLGRCTQRFPEDFS